ncbi:hypothetical protein ACFCX6_16690 [Streptomyces sp. NPDC056353]|uniref:hypothetical protein n=1 Tax=Streptomyces sp. NPDC056353 TaxID=3345792 RepID=UPI0035DD29C2
MDGSVWVGAIFGVGGTIVGGVLSLWATVIAQRQQAHASRQLAIAQRVDTAVDSAIQMFFQIKQHVRGRSSEFEEGAQSRIDLWQRSLQQQVNKLEPILLRIRDESFRLRLSKIAELLAWSDVSEPGLEGSPQILADLCDHALDCLGAFVRDEQLPPEGTGLTQARRVEALYSEHMEELALAYEEGHH